MNCLFTLLLSCVLLASSASADCHGAAALIATKLDEARISIHIDATMQCDDGNRAAYRSRDGVITKDTTQEDVAMMIVAMGHEVVDYFAAAGYDNNFDDLMKHLGLRMNDPSTI